MKSLMLVTLLYTLAVSSSRNKDLDGRIVGGDKIPIESVPYQVSLEDGDGSFCGGAIISAIQIVTAAHCFVDRTQNENLGSIRAGTTTLESGGHVIPISRVLPHPNYDEEIQSNDIAIVELSSALTFGNSVQPIALPSTNQAWPPGTEVVVAGWGALSESSEELPNVYGKYYVAGPMLCAGVYGGGKDACTGDSGSPMVVSGVLGGIVSFGAKCGVEGYPGVYANVPALRDFIEAVTGL